MIVDLAPHRPRGRKAATAVLVTSLSCLAWTGGYYFAAHDTPRMGLAEAMRALETDLHPKHREAMVAVVRDRVVQGIRALHEVGGDHARLALEAIIREAGK